MNQQETAPTDVKPTPVAPGDIPGIARIESIAESGQRIAAVAKTTNTLLGDLVAGILRLSARILSPALIESSLSLSKKIGHYAVLAGGVLTVVYAIYGAIKFNSFATFAIGLGCVVALAVAQFAAIRFLGAADTLISSTPSRISSSAFLECTGLLVLLGAVATLLGGVTGSIVGRTFMPLLPAIVFCITLTLFGAIALHPRTVNVATGDGTAGEEAIGLLSFFFKAGLKLAPLFFALLSLAGGVTILLSFFGESGAFAGVAQSVAQMLPVPVQPGSALVLFGCLVPIISYFIFLLQYLVVDLMQAILSVPGKLDAMRR